MKEELQSKLVEILTSIQTAAGKASDFAMEQLPDIAQSYVLYGRVSSTFFVVASLLVLSVVWLVFVPRGVKGWSKSDPGFPLFIGAIASVFPVMVAGGNFSGMLLVWFAPKVWLLKEIASLIR